MNNSKVNKKSLIVLSVVMMAAAVACSPASSSVETDAAIEQLQEPAVSSESAPLHNQLLTASTDELTEAEVESLLFMREEEKLAGDVFHYFHNLWGSPIFQNVAESEDMHTESVLSLLNLYGTADTAVLEAGVYSNADLQELYDQLILQGSQSLKDALLVAAAIEEIDILDLEKYIAQTDNADIIMVYENLAWGSDSHLRAFVRVLSNQYGVDYVPQYLTQERFDEIMEGSNGAGFNSDGQGNGQGVGKGANQ